MECIICLESNYSKIIRNPKFCFYSPCCKKPFHFYCILCWSNINNSCPICRTKNIVHMVDLQEKLLNIIFYHTDNSHLLTLNTYHSYTNLLKDIIHNKNKLKNLDLYLINYYKSYYNYLDI